MSSASTADKAETILPRRTRRLEPTPVPQPPHPSPPLHPSSQPPSLTHFPSTPLQPVNPLAQHTPSPNFRQLSSTNTDHLDFMHVDSVYIDPKMNTSTPNPTAPATTATAGGAPGGGNAGVMGEQQGNGTVLSEVNAKRQRNRREERQLRLAAEQAAWLREKFSLSPSENLIASFSAALVRHILLQGRMYITTSFICFYTRIFGKVTKECFPFSSLARVKKRRGGFVANAIKIYFADEDVAPVVIGSLNHREKTFNLIQQQLQVLNPSAAEGVGGEDDGSGASVASGRGADSDDRSLDGNEFTAEVIDGNAVQAVNGDVSAESVTRKQDAQREDEDISDSYSQRNSDVVEAISKSIPPSAAGGESSGLVWRTVDDVYGRVYANAYHKKSERARGILNAPVKEVFNVLFISDWLKHYHDAAKNKEVMFSEWRRGDDGFMSRDVSFRRPMGYRIGPKETRVRERQRYSFTEGEGVIIEVQGENLDVPYGKCFVIESFFELEPHGNGSQTLIMLSIAVHFVKSTMLQGTIESGALTETKVAFQRMLDMAKEKIDSHFVDRKAVRGEQGGAGGNTAVRENSGASGARTVANGNATAGRRGSGPILKTSATDEGRRVESDTVRRRQASSDGGNGVDNGRGGGRTSEDVAARGAQWRLEEAMVVSRGTSVEIEDSSTTQWLRMATLGTLVLACLLLIVELVVLHRVHRSISALEGMVLQRVRAGGVDGAAGVCA